MARGLTRTLFAAMLREEWRMHSLLFGGRRFAAFPLFVAAMGVAATWGLLATGTDPTTLVGGLHALVFAFGLHTGSVGLVGRDALRNVLGQVDLLVFSARTLPVSQRRLLVVFLVKDVAYYSVLFLLPLTAALAPVVTAPSAALAAAALPWLWASLVATFLLGSVVTFAAIALSTRGWPGRGLALAAVAGAVWAWQAGHDPVAWTPYGVFRDPSVAGALLSAGAVLALAALSVAAFDTTAERSARTAGNAFGTWRARLRDGDGLLTRSLLDVARSSGGLWKVAFSAGVLFAVTHFLLGLVETVTGVEPAPGASFGAVLGLSAFTTYNWLTQFDAPRDYLAYPVSVPAVFRAKFRAFLLLGLPTGLGFLALALALRGSSAVDALAGVALLVGLSLYLFGLTVYLTGFSPNEFLFDTVLFAAFGLAVAVPLVPVLVVAFVVTPSTATLAALLVAGAVFAVAGHRLYGRAVPKWERRLRTGEA